MYLNMIVFKKNSPTFLDIIFINLKCALNPDDTNKYKKVLML